MEKQKEPISYIYSLKCQNTPCRLEYVVLSYYDDWLEKHTPHCPECNEQDVYLIKQVASEKPICSISYNGWGNGKT